MPVHDLTASFGLLEIVSCQHRTCQRVRCLEVVEAWRCRRADGPVAAFTFQLAWAHERYQSVRDLLRCWRVLASKHPRAQLVLTLDPHEYSPEERRALVDLVRAGRQCGVLNKRAVILRPRRWLVKPVMTADGPDYFRGGWLELFALLVCQRVAARAGPKGMEPVARLKLAVPAGTIAYELDVVMPLSNGKVLIVEAKSGATNGGSAKLVAYGKRSGLDRKYRVLLTAGAQETWHDGYVHLGPSAFQRYVSRLCGLRVNVDLGYACSM